MNKEELIKEVLLKVEGLFDVPLNIKEYGFLFRKYLIDSNYTYEIKVLKFNWVPLTDIKERNEWLTYYVTYKLVLEGEVIIQSGSNIINKERQDFELFVDLWANLDGKDSTFKIMDEDNKLIKDYIQKIEELNHRSNNFSLFDTPKLIDSKNPMSFASEMLEKICSLKNKFNYNIIIDDIIRCSQDLQYLFGEILFLKPFITDFTANPLYFKGKVYYNPENTFIDKRYYFLCGIVYETLYNFWSKIGNLIAEYIPLKLRKNEIFFPKVIEVISSPYDQNSNYLLLKVFKEKEYNQLNTERKNVVHYKSIESKYWEMGRPNLNSSKNKSTLYDNGNEVRNMQNQKEDDFIYLEKQIKLTFEGVENALKFINETGKKII